MSDFAQLLAHVTPLVGLFFKSSNMREFSAIVWQSELGVGYIELQLFWYQRFHVTPYLPSPVNPRGLTHRHSHRICIDWFRSLIGFNLVWIPSRIELFYDSAKSFAFELLTVTMQISISRHSSMSACVPLPIVRGPCKCRSVIQRRSWRPVIIRAASGEVAVSSVCQSPEGSQIFLITPISQVITNKRSTGKQANMCLQQRW